MRSEPWSGCTSCRKPSAWPRPWSCCPHSAFRVPVPSTPGYIGVYQFAAVSVLVPFGFSRADALAYILFSQVMNYIVVSSWGLIGLWQIHRHKELTRPSND